MSHSLTLRRNILLHKLAGRLPGFSWMSLVRLLPQSTNAWPRLPFAHPLRSEGGRTLFATPFGQMWAPPDEQAALGLTVLEMLANIYFHGPVQIHSGDVVLDMGANLGIFALIALRHGATRVICFEANPQLVGCLQQTFAAEAASGKVVVVAAPLWSEEVPVKFGGDSLTGKIGESGAEVSAVTVDATCARLGLDRVDFIKADIEGAERHALRGARQTLARFAPKLALCIYHLPDDLEVISAEVMASRPYQTAVHASGDFLYGW